MERSQLLSDDDVFQLARRQLADYDRRSPGGMFAEPGFVLNVDDAYRLQIASSGLRSARGEIVAGYKIGCVSERIRRQLVVDGPVFGHVFQSEIRTSPVRVSVNEFCCPAIEGEFAVRLGSDLPDPDRLLAEPDRFIGGIFPVIELHNYVFRGPSPRAAELIANNALQAGIVVPVRTGSLPFGEPAPIRVVIGDRVDACAEVDPCLHLHELACRLANHGIRSRKGDLLLTGSPLPLYRVEEEDSVRVTSPGTAEVAAVFAAC